MPDRWKVVKGLECCRSRHLNLCNECPYFGSNTNPDDEDDDTCTFDLNDDALELLKEQQKEYYHLRNMLCDAQNELNNQPKVVRCKDCKFYPNGNGSSKWLPCMEIITPPCWFCADGEKKEGDGE